MSDRYNEALEAAAKACRNEKFLAVSLIGEQYNDACDDCAKAILALREADPGGQERAAPASPGLVMVCRQRIEGLLEYWNGHQNERAMLDALTHIQEELCAMLAAADEERSQNV